MEHPLPKATNAADNGESSWHRANWAILTKNVLRGHFARQACA